MQIHPPSALVGAGEFEVHLHHGHGDPFAIINVDPDGTRTRIFVETLADCDRLDRATAKARALLAGNLAGEDDAAWEQERNDRQPAGTDAS